METIRWAFFEKVTLTAGNILDVLEFPEVRKPAYKLQVIMAYNQVIIPGFNHLI
jgi:hypothetical protein